MSEEKLNEQYIKDHIQGICQDCIYLDKIVPIIREMLSEAYINGLEQGKFDRQMIELENQKYKEVIDKAKYWVEDYMNEWDTDDEVWQELNELLILLEEVE